MSNFKISQKNSLTSIKVDQIPDEPGRFSMSYGFDNTELKRSISQVGIINNPYIYRKNDRTIEVVTGFRRILALKDLCVKKVECIDLTDSGMTLYDMLKLALHENRYTREFNLVEKSIILNKLTSLVNEYNSINEINSLINVSAREYDLVLKIEGMHKSIKGLISTRALNIKALEQLFQLREDDQLICTSWVDKLKLNYNQQIQFIDYIADIARIENISIQKLLNDGHYISLISNTKKNVPQKAKELIDNLRKRRNPDYSKYQHLFEKKIRKLHLPKNIKINHPRYFESEFYQLEVEFKDGNKLKESLSELINRDELSDIGDPWVNE